MDYIDSLGYLVPGLMTEPPAPESIIELVVCAYLKDCRGQWRVRQVSLPCTAACKCDGLCNNVEVVVNNDKFQ